MLDDPLHHWAVVLDGGFDARLEPELDYADLLRHVLHGLLARPVALRVVGRRVLRGAARAHVLEGRLHSDHRRVPVGLEVDVVAIPLLRVADQPIHKPLVAGALADGPLLALRPS